ncbi:MAG: VPLPA-CTERM sorting domain-containing protein, partial [Proteobacteria bacterium]|nr:VPLPA-CTERM sorting domain-containing protein [Pseudomonadota bacterium]
LFLDEVEGGGEGIFFNEKDSLILTITGFDASLLSKGLTLEIFPIKFQGVGFARDSFQLTGTLKSLPETEEMPEPASLLLFGTGLLGLGVFARRRRRFAA